MFRQKRINLLPIILLVTIGVTGCSIDKPNFYMRSLIHLESQSAIVSPENQVTGITFTMSPAVQAEWPTLSEREFSTEDFSDSIKKEFIRVNLYNDAPKIPNLTLHIELTEVRLRSTLQARDLGMATGVDYIRANVSLKDASGNIVLKSYVKSPDLYYCPSKTSVLGIPVAGCGSKERAEWLYGDMAEEIYAEITGKIKVENISR
jgi:hypothetical protein